MSADDYDSPEERFTVLLNGLMAQGIEADADTEAMAKVCINTARELYDHYGADEGYGNFLELVTSVGFETAEIEAYLDSLDE